MIPNLKFTIVWYPVLRNFTICFLYLFMYIVQTSKFFGFFVKLKKQVIDSGLRHQRPHLRFWIVLSLNYKINFVNFYVTFRSL